MQPSVKGDMMQGYWNKVRQHFHKKKAQFKDKAIATTLEHKILDTNEPDYDEIELEVVGDPNMLLAVYDWFLITEENLVLNIWE